MTARWLAAVAVLAGCGSKDSEPPAPTGPVVVTITGDAGAAPIELVGEQFPDATWTTAAKIALRSFTTSFTRISVTRVKMAPITSPDGEVVPHLMSVEAFVKDKSVFKGVALVSNNAMINSGGPPRLTKFLASLGFPGERKLHAGLLVELLYVMNVKLDWLVAPSVRGWDGFKTKLAGTGYEPAVVSCDGGGCLLTLYRDGKSPGNGTPPLERLEVRFAADATFTMTAARRAGETSPWEPFAP